MARVRGEIHFLWRLILIPLFVLYLRLFGIFDFIYNIATVRFVDYAWNLLMLGICFAGLMLLLIANPRRRFLAGLGVCLLVSPLYLEGVTFEFRAGEAGLQITSVPLHLISVFVVMSAAMWGLLMLRGPKKREWEKAVLALFLFGRLAALVMWKDASRYGYFWHNDIYIFACSVMIGSAADAVYRGLTLPNVIVPLLSWGSLIAAALLPEVELWIILCAVMALSIVYITVLICRKPAKNMYLGFILSLLGLVAYGALYLMEVFK